MPEARDIGGSVFKNGSATLLARVIGWDGAVLAPGGVSSIVCTTALLDDQDPDVELPVAGHENVPLAVEAVLSATLRLDALWTRDAVGYNFKHVLPLTQPLFTLAGRNYRVCYRILPTDGPVILVRYRLHAV